MHVRPARRPRPALAALVVGLLLACACLMWGPGHTTMAMADAMPGMAMTMTMTTRSADRETGHLGPQAAPAHQECPAMSMDCPLATAHSPVPVAPAAAPGPDTITTSPATATHPTPRPAELCGWPRAPDPVALLCVSRT